MEMLRFEQNRSRFAKLFQLFILLSLIILFHAVLTPFWWLFSVLGLCASWILSLRRSKVSCFAYLDGKSWSLCYCQSTDVHRVSIRQIIDHLCYVVVYLDGEQPQTVVIWWDQLSLSQWKRLKMLKNLY